jgi:endonuclease/exonuclease/phosphatase family metal-dependent hydrolase
LNRFTRGAAYVAATILILLPHHTVFGQDSTSRIVIAWWNTENLFDTVNDRDPLPQFGSDDEFTPEGEKHWTEDRYKTKLAHLASTIRSMNLGKGPDVMGFCEVEHKHILAELANEYLADLGYAVAYHESPDARGIDVGFLYKRGATTLTASGFRRVALPSSEPPTRDVFYVVLNTTGGPLVCIGNHWPSRRGGAEASAWRRMRAAEATRAIADSFLVNTPEANLVIMGDFNDEPTDSSIANTLRATGDRDAVTTTSSLLFDCMSSFGSNQGTYNYRGTWNMLDQFILSPALLTGHGLTIDHAEIYRPTFLVEQGGAYAGYPFPTYGGRRYLGGYSDHFPILLFLTGVSR